MLNIFLAKLQKNFDIWASEIKIFFGFFRKECNIFRIDRILSFLYEIQISSKTNNVWIFKFLGTNKINNLDANIEIRGYK